MYSLCIILIAVSIWGHLTLMPFSALQPTPFALVLFLPFYMLLYHCCHTLTLRVTILLCRKPSLYRLCYAHFIYSPAHFFHIYLVSLELHKKSLLLLNSLSILLAPSSLPLPNFTSHCLSLLHLT